MIELRDSQEIQDAIADLEPRSPQIAEGVQRLTFRRLRGGLLVIIGYLLSPLCWWNDLIFNLPIAYGFGYLCSWLVSDWLVPGAIAGYWISNIVGILLMQFGAIDVWQEQPKPHNLKQELITGIVSSTAYTLLIVALVKFHILNLSGLFLPEGTLSLSALPPIFSVTQ
jgi:hypothetical protein